jgi:2-amino-4-hydroxy-6-hydroxymethyldihydropteridine diphosphokinase
MEAFLIFGSNMGNRPENLQKAIDTLCHVAGPCIRSSSIYETAPWGFDSDQKFLNQVLIIETGLEAHELLRLIHVTELAMGRMRDGKGYRSRPIDIDILFFADTIVQSQTLTIPHPRLHERNFVLVPLQEIAPAFIHPLFGVSVEELGVSCNDQNEVILWNP